MLPYTISNAFVYFRVKARILTFCLRVYCVSAGVFLVEHSNSSLGGAAPGRGLYRAPRIRQGMHVLVLCCNVKHCT
jgi:hypothetical protein